MSILKWVGGAGDGFFNHKGNWSPCTVPNSTSDVVIEPSSAITIVATTAAVNSLVTNANISYLAVAATEIFTIFGVPDAANPTGASTNGGTFSLGQCAELFLDGQFTNAALLVTGHGSEMFVNAAFTNTGAVDQNGAVTLGDATHAGTLTNRQGATWSIGSDSEISAGAAGSHLSNAGMLTSTGTGVTDIGVSATNSGNVSVTSGELAFLSSVSNTGTMTAAGATLSLDKAVSGAGTLDLGAGGALNLVGGSDAGQTVDFLGNATLDLHAPGDFRGHITGFGAGDLIDLNIMADNKSFSGGVLTLSEGSTPVAHLNFNGAYSTSSFSLSSEPSGGTQIHFV